MIVDYQARHSLGPADWLADFDAKVNMTCFANRYPRSSWLTNYPTGCLCRRDYRRTGNFLRKVVRALVISPPFYSKN